LVRPAPGTVYLFVVEEPSRKAKEASKTLSSAFHRLAEVERYFLKPVWFADLFLEGVGLHDFKKLEEQYVWTQKELRELNLID